MTPHFVRLSARWGAAALALALLAPIRPAAGQGVTTAAVAGRITDDAGAPVAIAEVMLVSAATGERHTTRTRVDGWYSVENVSVGGPYTATIRALGFEPKRSEPFMVTLGQRLILNLSLRRAAIEVAAVSVTAESDPLRSTSRTGAQTTVSERAIQRLPTLNRSFTDFMSTAPQIVGRSVTGQNDRFNNIQIDGGSNNDLFNLGSTNGTPGGSVNARPLNLEAVKEYQILIAPFDVRQGGFVGGLVNAVTKSGTNNWHGSAFGYMQNQNFVGKDTSGVRVPVAQYEQQQYGFSLGGPIMKDRMHFFMSGDFRHDARPFASSVQLGPTGDTTGVGITAARFDSVRNILINQYGFDPGSYSAPIIPNPETNLFGKLGYELGTNSHVELSGTYVNADRIVLGHSYRANYTAASGNLRDGYILSNSGYDFTDHTRTVRGKWTSLLGSRYSNELIVGYSTISDVRELPNRVPLILVGGNSPGSYIAAGAERFSQANTLNQKVIEVSDNLTFMMHEHQITVGTHNEFFHFVNVFFPGSIGIWNFASPDSLANGLPNQYFRALPTVQRPDGPLADFHVKQYGFYVQDRFSPVRNLTVTAGVRIDVPSQPAPATNPILRDSITFPAIGGTGINTGAFPSGNILWSPRLGFNYDVTGDRSTVLRGGVGIFSGRPPYVWVANAYGNTGQEQQSLYCTGASVPTFTVDPDNQPTTCAAAPSAGRPSIVYFDSDFKFPQAMKVAVGIDQQLGWGIVGTVDFLLTKSVNQFFLQDVNLVGIQGTSSGEAGRPRFGTIAAATGAATAARVTARYLDVIRNTNASGDRSTSLTAQLQKRFSNGIEFSASYTYGHSLDRISMTSDITGSNYSFSVLDGTPDHRNLRTSFFDRPHKFTINGSMNTPFDTRFSLTYNGLSGTPFTYVVNGDINADGVSGNDPVYVPRGAADITTQTPAQFAAIDAFINGERCLRENRGRILPRNSCRNQWQNFLNARVSKVVPTLTGHSIEITADMLNVLNFLNSHWGLTRVTGTGFENQNMIRLAGYDAVNQRGIYAPILPTKNQVTLNSLGSRWVFQLGARYTF